MRSSASFRGKDAKRVFNHLILVNVVVIALDITIVAFQFAGLFYLQTSWKTLAYAIKLKLEFDILTQLVDFTKQGFKGASGSRHISGTAEGRDQTRSGAQDDARGSRFGISSYARMDEEGTTAYPLREVMKTTEIEVRVEEDAASQSSTKELRTRTNTLS